VVKLATTQLVIIYLDDGRTVKRSTHNGVVTHNYQVIDSLYNSVAGATFNGLISEK